MTAIPQHVLIIGGGLAGPCLALSLARRNIRTTIFEIRPTRSDSGGSISLGPNALQVLDKHAGIYGQLRDIGFSYHRFGAYAEDGEKLGEILVGDESDGGYPALRIMRSTLHKALLDAGEKMEGMIDVKYGARLERIEEDDKGVTAYFEDGSSAKGDILIGADGVHSKVRQHVLGPKAPAAIFEGLIVVNGFLSRSSAIIPNPAFSFPAFLFTPSGLFMAIPIDAQGEQLAWGINTSVDERPRDEWRALESSGEAARLAKAGYNDITWQPVRSLLDNADEKEARIWTPYKIPDIPTWHTPRVCLIGDAAHALPPNGQGSALAFEDAAIMARLLTELTSDKPSYDMMFAQFEAIRRPRIDRLRSESKKGGAIKSKTGPWVWVVKKWAFRVFFWWNSGVLRHTDETTYDVDKVELQ